MTSPRGGPGPFSGFLGFRFERADADGARMTAVPAAEHCNGGGIVHGGYLAALLDSTTGWAVHAALPEGAAAPHVQLTVQYVRAALPDRELVCEAQVVAAGRRIASARAELRQGERIVATAVSSHAVLTGG
ncbi:PaaI family thioesterase [Nocardioides litoris]|uniref:PaaI family thioesterase n=1 Tax=Nocardioides litoris TaxID=1926648 RepID=UPI001FE9636E|nr:PaaI family thioesterase [Nocardioides litoris]